MIDVIAMIFGGLGTLLLSSEREIRKKELYVFYLYFPANIFWIVYSILVGSQGLFWANILYILVSIKGIRKNLKRVKDAADTSK